MQQLIGHSTCETANLNGATTLTEDLNALFINHRNFEWVMKEVLGALRRAPLRNHEPALHISGPAGIGKSSIGKQTERQYPRIRDGRELLIRGFRARVDHVPVLRIRLTEQPSVKSVSRAILKKLGDENYLKGDVFSLTDRVDLYTQACGTIAYVLDDAHRMMDRSGIVTAEKLLDWLYDRRDENNVRLVLLGMGRLGHLIGQDLQVERRSNAELRLEPYKWWRKPGVDFVEDQEQFAGVLLAMIEGAKIELDKTFDLTRDLDLYRFWYISRGSTGFIKKHLECVAAHHENDGRTDRSITMADLLLAAKTAFPLAEHRMVNPFAADFDMTNVPPPLQNDANPLPDPRQRRMTKAQKARALNEHLSK